jgi:hypothetical protein
MARISKQQRQQLLRRKIGQSPFVNDEEMAEEFDVSVATIRLDRLAMGIPELRVRIKQCAQEHVPQHRMSQVVGELIDCNAGKSAISLLTATADMVDHVKIVQSQYLYAQANSLAAAVLNLPVVITAVGNIKYKQPVTVGDRLLAKAEVIRRRDHRYYVWVTIRKKEKEVFRAKFIMESLE